MSDEITPLEGQAPIEGQGEPTPPEGQGVQAPADDGEGYFYSYTDPRKGETKSFRDQNELNEYVSNLNKSYGELRSKFTKTTQEYADRNRSYENDRAMFLQQKAEFEKRREEIAHLDKFLKTNPHVYKQIKQNMNKGPSGGDLQEMIDNRVKEIYGKEFDELKSHRDQVKAEKVREAAFQNLKKKYGEVDIEAINEKFKILSQGDLTDVYELIHLSNRPNSSQQKRDAGLLPAASGTPSSGGPNHFKSIDEWVEANQNTI